MIKVRRFKPQIILVIILTILFANMKKIITIIALTFSGLALAEKDSVLYHDVYQHPNEFYSMAIRSGQTVYISGQLPVDRQTGKLVNGGFNEQARQVFSNIRSIAQTAGGSIDSIIKVNIYITDLSNYSIANNLIAEFFHTPFPARSVMEVKSLPQGALIEIDAIMDKNSGAEPEEYTNLASSSNHICLPKNQGECGIICRKEGYRSGYCKGSKNSTGVCVCSD